MDFKWEAVSAIGQVLGAIATFWAVLVALRQGNPKIIINSNARYHPIFPSRILKGTKKIWIANTGSDPIQIDSIGFYAASIDSLEIEYDKSKFPKILIPGKRITCDVEVLTDNKIGIIQAYALDGFGRFHREKLYWPSKILNFFLCLKDF